MLEEMNRMRIAAMLAADAELKVRPVCDRLHAHAYQRAHTLDVDGHERILVEDLLIQVDPEELADVIARKAESELGQIVRAEREELAPPAQSGRR